MFEHENAGVTHCPVEVRHPFLDLRIVNFLLALPPFPFIFREEAVAGGGGGAAARTHSHAPEESSDGRSVDGALGQPQTPWMDQLDWTAEIESYIDRSALAMFGNETISAKVDADIRPLCLNFWLQSARRVRYNLRAEVRNG